MCSSVSLKTHKWTDAQTDPPLPVTKRRKSARDAPAEPTRGTRVSSRTTGGAGLPPPLQRSALTHGSVSGVAASVTSVASSSAAGSRRVSIRKAGTVNARMRAEAARSQVAVTATGRRKIPPPSKRVMRSWVKRDYPDLTKITVKGLRDFARINKIAFRRKSNRREMVETVAHWIAAKVKLEDEKAAAKGYSDDSVDTSDDDEDEDSEDYEGSEGDDEDDGDFDDEDEYKDESDDQEASIDNDATGNFVKYVQVNDAHADQIENADLLIADVDGKCEINKQHAEGRHSEANAGNEE